MAGKGLIISIDYTDEYCQACYFSNRHLKAESVSAGADVMRYLIPSVLCYDPEQSEWAIGNAALRLSGKAGVVLFRDLMKNVFAGTSAYVNGKSYTAADLAAIYFKKMLEFIQVRTSIMTVENITVTMRKTGNDIKSAVEKIFGLLNISPSKVKLLSSAESFGYYILNEPAELWEKGALLFDFSNDGFFAKQLNFSVHGNRKIVYIDEYDFSNEFAVFNLASGALSAQLDKKLTNLYLDFSANSGVNSVYFTGEGFDDQWFETTLNTVSASGRAFKGNNIYAKGACLAGYLRAVGKECSYPVLCNGRTRTDISLQAWDDGKLIEILLSPAAVDWYDAGYEGDFILEEERSITFKIRSVQNEQSFLTEVDLSAFPIRPEKTTRVGITIRYINEMECVITILDKGFGDFYPDGGNVVSKNINLEGFF